MYLSEKYFPLNAEMASVTMTASSIALQPQQAAAQMRQRHADARCEYQVRSYSDLLQQKGQKRTKSGFRSNPPPFLTQHEITQYHRQYESKDPTMDFLCLIIY